MEGFDEILGLKAEWGTYTGTKVFLFVFTFIRDTLETVKKLSRRFVSSTNMYYMYG